MDCTAASVSGENTTLRAEPCAIGVVNGCCESTAAAFERLDDRFGTGGGGGGIEG
jgi:hypothetical protein